MFKQKSIRCNRIASIGYADRDETINLLVSEYRKLAQKKYKTRYDWMGKVIDWKWYKRWKLDHDTK